MDLHGYKIKNKTTCECGYNFTIKDMKKLQRIYDSKFYGGIVRHVDEIKCPKCGKETLLLIKQTGQTYIVKDIAQIDDKEITNTNNSVNNKQEKELSNSNEFICSICKRTFKNKAGLSLHMKTHKANSDINLFNI